MEQKGLERADFQPMCYTLPFRSNATKSLVVLYPFSDGKIKINRSIKQLLQVGKRFLLTHMDFVSIVRANKHLSASSSSFM